jgi:glycosyltransferase involved in cell wall biosynthesis
VGERRLVVCFGSYDASLHPRVAVLRDGLAATEDVVEINVPLGLSTADKIDAATSVGGALRLAMAITRSWWGLWRLARARRLEPDLVVVGYLGHFDVHLARLLWPRTPIALDHLVGLADTSRDRGVAQGLKARVLDLIDRAALWRADIVIVDTEEQRSAIDRRLAAKAVVVPVGATDEWFGHEAAPAVPPVTVCFVGLYTPLHGAPVIGSAITALADDDRLRFTMIGTGQDLDATKAVVGANPHVRWIDWVDSSELPSVVASHHVTLGIFGTTPKALRVVPTKVYQGLAAGTVVITSDTPPQRRALGDAARFVPPGDADALAAELVAVADELIAAGDAAAEGHRDAAERFRPASVVTPILAGLSMSLDARCRRGRRRRARARST